jgi:hypothetical protein
MENLQVYLMKEYSAIVESSWSKQNNKDISYQLCSINDEKYGNIILTEAHCKRNADGARIRTGHESWTHEATAMACKSQ